MYVQWILHAFSLSLFLSSFSLSSSFYHFSLSLYVSLSIVSFLFLSLSLDRATDHAPAPHGRPRSLRTMVLSPWLWQGYLSLSLCLTFLSSFCLSPTHANTHMPYLFVSPQHSKHPPFFALRYIARAAPAPFASTWKYVTK